IGFLSLSSLTLLDPPRAETMPRSPRRSGARQRTGAATGAPQGPLGVRMNTLRLRVIRSADSQREPMSIWLEMPLSAGLTFQFPPSGASAAVASESALALWAQRGARPGCGGPCPGAARRRTRGGNQIARWSWAGRDPALRPRAARTQH